ncbi:hypothetical protein [Nitrosopumilus ureiphilus]|uniref:hypothetical protein n=1 Tax=Nitrosopumilus ureiphilus TaxID=1470067 RepID=UPI001FE52E50|nr:hypothetical protein [Nitrosopumilus ureiphilus]
MKTRLLMILIGILSVVGMLFFLFYVGILGGSCIEGKNLDGTCMEPKMITVPPRTNGDFSEQEKNQILTQLRQGPQNINGTAKQFLVSAALDNPQLKNLIKDTTYQVNCCTYTLDGKEYPHPLYVGITFQLNEKDILVTAEYDLQQEEITDIEIQEGVRTGGLVSFESENTAQYLGKTLSEWREYSSDELYQISKTDKNFHKELSRMAIKDHMKKQLSLNNITNTNNNFKVFSGWWQSNSLGFNSVINSTDGKSYLVLGSAAYHTVGDYFEIRELKFDHGIHDKNDFYFSDNSVVEISPDPNNPSKVSDYDVIINLNQTNKVTFQNNLPTIIRIQENRPGDVDEQTNLKWIGPTILPGMYGDMTFENIGHYEWNAREPIPFATVWPMKGSGEISVIGSDTDSLPLKTKLKIAQSFAKLSDVPWSGLGAGEPSLDVDLYSSIYEMIPDAKKYYTQQLEAIIPFDVPITLEEPNYYDYGQDNEN